MSARLADLERLYDANAARIFRYVYHRLGDQQLAQDLTSEAFVRFLHAKATPDNPTAFLYRIAHNLIVDYAREHRPVALPVDLVCRDGDDPVAAAELELERVRLRRAIARLTPDQQQVIVLKFLEGLSNDEIAHVLDKPVGAVKALQHRGLAALRDQLSFSRPTLAVEEAGVLK
ncbi:MAG: sigma-70 family RNA polymerase sigma factor [Chloroflexi bacterium]|nr:sigma-70 family RNA polymerase sigma factor [Chloroflexota bacterium]